SLRGARSGWGLTGKGGLSADEPPPVVAFAISVTSLELPAALSMLDAAEVLIASIDRTCRLSSYRCEKIAFVLTSVPESGRRHLEAMGWKLLEKDIPVAVADIEDEFYRNHVVKSGCCGADEFLKLHAYTLTDYHRVLHLDIDTLMLHPMDELMELNASLLYTTDPVMALKGQTIMPVQGGFLLVRPDLVVYQKLCDIIRRGDWKVGEGWAGSKIGYFYGGPTIQGLLAYFYHVIAPGTAIELDRCIYNHMSDSDKCRSAPYLMVTTDGNYGKMGGNAVVDQLGEVNVLPIKSVHFTQSCAKPWKCAEFRMGAKHPGPCASLQSEWLEGRHTLFRDRGLPFKEACGAGSYSAVPRRQ
ncbi:unnamed protein product, partial [Ascophyllum nodosum]